MADATSGAKPRKTQKKTLPPHLTPGNPGNSGGKPGRSGRLPSPFKAFLAKLRADPGFHAAIETAAKDPSSRGYSAALKLVSEYDEDKPAEKQQIVGPIEVSVRIVREGRRVTAS